MEINQKSNEQTIIVYLVTYYFLIKILLLYIFYKRVSSDSSSSNCFKIIKYQKNYLSVLKDIYINIPIITKQQIIIPMQIPLSEPGSLQLQSIEQRQDDGTIRTQKAQFNIHLIIILDLLFILNNRDQLYRDLLQQKLLNCYIQWQTR
ncbi:transmembrane protein, putative (macronuclear) [Tetrahymena thermophila SB210]|uniref:Transmembrane protein, putative n=1 Tax=Tetrahymena thermophila (strain SB210) TaxID=312017 RepID=W7XBC3_TETTS|nr:transmembrane protein, putative [Tetrahymena thermophila SB210]EWS74627.1 transmembrane protein, putative [Tetrahymena thermophila SB210]|eukprot:XP_012652849.1 transmembrane protein, putative [Tetrahymena thermophila SB210]